MDTFTVIINRLNDKGGVDYVSDEIEFDNEREALDSIAANLRDDEISSKGKYGYKLFEYREVPLKIETRLTVERA